jgi:acylphosphatase
MRKTPLNATPSALKFTPEMARDEFYDVQRRVPPFYCEARVCYNFAFVNEPKQARKYLVSGTVQGVGFRYFTQRAAAKLKGGGYVRNLRDGRVEVFVMGTPQQLHELRTILEHGPRFSSVTEVREEAASPDPQYEENFVIGYTD